MPCYNQDCSDGDEYARRRPEERWGLGCELRPGAGQNTTPEPQASESSLPGAPVSARWSALPSGRERGWNRGGLRPMRTGAFLFLGPAVAGRRG